MVYGAAKTGKTAGALTFPRPVVLDFDRGVATARSEWFVKTYGLRWVFYETFVEKDMNKGVPKTANAFDDACKFFDEWMKPSGRWTSPVNGKRYEVGRDQFDTFVIDSGTTLSEHAQYKAIIVLGSFSKPLSFTHKEALSLGVIIPKIQDFGSERSLVEQFIDMVRDSGKNVVLICHEKEVISEAGTQTGIVPLLTGKSSETVPLKFDEVYNLRIKKVGLETTRYLQTEPDGVRKVGSRYGIPDESAWNYDTIQTALKKIKAAQASQVVTSDTQGRTTSADPTQTPAIAGERALP
jgi:hypothetical protein